MKSDHSKAGVGPVGLEEAASYEPPSEEDDVEIPKYFAKEMLREILRKSVLKGDYKMPSDKSLEKLGRSLDDLRFIIPLRNGEWREVAEFRSSVRTAVAYVEQSIPTLIGDIRRDRKRKSSNWAQERSSDPDYTALIALQVAINNFKSRPFIYGNGEASDATIVGWKNMAVALSNWFREAMASTNPERKFGNSNGGPVSRFVSAMLPEITGESVEPETVSAFLKQEARQEGIFCKATSSG